ncbi:MAG: endo-1,3-alpha-glucanase family glycosylhydrolase [Planctomycetia bacterium]|nr:endo-1,3-alpha-glucanase family glycosylhydrolase [Planctomycetia bacterium]
MKNSRTTFRIVSLCAALLFTELLFAADSMPEKKIFAHYMGCFPVGYGAIDYHRNHLAKELRHDSSNSSAAVGGRMVNFPLTPPSETLTPEQSATLEIQRALRAGIDGFAVDAWAGGDGARQVFGNLIRAAEQLDVPFEITVCMDANCHPADPERPGDHIAAYSDTIRWILDNYGQSPKLARRNGKVLIFGYHSRDLYRTPHLADLPETPEKWQKIVDAYRQIEKNVGQDLFFHFCFDTFFLNVPPAKLPPNAPVDAARFLAKHFDAIGGFLGGTWWNQPEIIAAIHEGSAEWGTPMTYQYVNKAYMYQTGNGLDQLRQRWNAAIATRSTLLQFITWNDYGEDTILAPGYSTGYTLSSVHRYYVNLWKTGQTLPDEEQIHVIFRRHLWDATPYPFARDGMNGPAITPPGMLEVLTLLKEPGTVEVPDYGLKYDAPAGIFFRQVPLKTGPVSARLLRKGQTVLTVAAPEHVTDNPLRRDVSMVCFSSHFDAEWKKDFPQSPPLHYSEYGDLDADGLPNFWEMYWFGTFPRLETATAALPHDDPDNDGFSNLQEYQNQTNPTVPQTPYNAHEVWTLDAIHARGLSFQPDRDAHDSPVWHYLYKLGPREQIPHDGNYLPCPYHGQNVPYAGQMAHFSPARDDMYPNVHGWIARKQADDKTWTLLLRPRTNALLILGWKSPIDGSVTLSGNVLPLQGQDGITLELAHNNQPLLQKTYSPGECGTFQIPPTPVQKGDFLYLIADPKPGYDASQLEIQNLSIRRVSP